MDNKEFYCEQKTKGRKQVWSRLTNFTEFEMKLLEKDKKENNGNETKLKKVRLVILEK